MFDPGPLPPQTVLSGERWGPSSRRSPSARRGDPIRRSFRATRLPPQTALSGEPSFSWAHMVVVATILQTGEGMGSSRRRPLAWPFRGFPATQRETRGSPALCVSGSFQGNQRVFGAPFCFSRVSLGKLASFPESESWSGAKSGAKLRKSANYPGIFQVCTMKKLVYPQNTGILPILLISAPKQPQTRLRAQNLTISTQFSRENREEKRGCCREKRKGKETGCERKSMYSLRGGRCHCRGGTRSCGG